LFNHAQNTTMVVLVLKKCESYLYNESQFHIKYNNRTKHGYYSEVGSTKLIESHKK
jgi:hypothetical protein